ncbi:hypothetical protein CC1G_05649 [Coprinopsis cinerea okayama7|uniref:Uncharacterized protein n=1 Tax=Coprinopsis cinerea (strain Okayama-7 / 130 / ATCC MYA-4618 / FGSC 9003) TaxID=240176 RepID=A8P1S8_COPC7|nr:hypothetical protein CC1G_05649 [Coprinopsis cinerea okayama7\|eukprot:XP_001838168.1 hypothetical protein CC1G_05649 [Coprinopsis cinerea okayama7\
MGGKYLYPSGGARVAPRGDIPQPQPQLQPQQTPTYTPLAPVPLPVPTISDISPFLPPSQPSGDTDPNNNVNTLNGSTTSLGLPSGDPNATSPTDSDRSSPSASSSFDGSSSSGFDNSQSHNPSPSSGVSPSSIQASSSTPSPHLRLVYFIPAMVIAVVILLILVIWAVQGCCARRHKHKRKHERRGGDGVFGPRYDGGDGGGGGGRDVEKGGGEGFRRGVYGEGGDDDREGGGGGESNTHFYSPVIAEPSWSDDPRLNRFFVGARSPYVGAGGGVVYHNHILASQKAGAGYSDDDGGGGGHGAGAGGGYGGGGIAHQWKSPTMSIHQRMEMGVDAGTGLQPGMFTHSSKISLVALGLGPDGRRPHDEGDDGEDDRMGKRYAEERGYADERPIGHRRDGAETGYHTNHNSAHSDDEEHSPSDDSDHPDSDSDSDSDVPWETLRHESIKRGIMDQVQHEKNWMDSLRAVAGSVFVNQGLEGDDRGRGKGGGGSRNKGSRRGSRRRGVTLRDEGPVPLPPPISPPPLASRRTSSRSSEAWIEEGAKKRRLGFGASSLMAVSSGLAKRTREFSSGFYRRGGGGGEVGGEESDVGESERYSRAWSPESGFKIVEESPLTSPLNSIVHTPIRSNPNTPIRSNPNTPNPVRHSLDIHSPILHTNFATPVHGSESQVRVSFLPLSPAQIMSPPLEGELCFSPPLGLVRTLEGLRGVRVVEGEGGLQGDEVDIDGPLPDPRGSSGGGRAMPLGGGTATQTEASDVVKLDKPRNRLFKKGSMLMGFRYERLPGGNVGGL